jgi:hypothetical protein
MNPTQESTFIQSLMQEINALRRHITPTIVVSEMPDSSRPPTPGFPPISIPASFYETMPSHTPLPVHSIPSRSQKPITPVSPASLGEFCIPETELQHLGLSNVTEFKGANHVNGGPETNHVNEGNPSPVSMAEDLETARKARERLQRRREVNRKAAARSRAKKKAQQEQLAGNLKKLKKDNQDS